MTYIEILGLSSIFCEKRAISKCVTLKMCINARLKPSIFGYAN